MVRKAHRGLMNRLVTPVLFVSVVGLVVSATCHCREMTAEEIGKELKALKERISMLEEQLARKKQEIKKVEEETKIGEEIPALMPGLIEEIKAEEGPLEFLQEHIQLNGLIEFGGVWAETDKGKGDHSSESDLSLTTAELVVQAKLNEWVRGGMFLLYRHPTFAAALKETGLDLDVGVVTIGNTERFPLYFTGGIFYVPFGGLLTHFPDNPLVDQPLPLALGEVREQAALLGLKYKGLSLSGYASKGEINKAGDENRIANFGFDARYSYKSEKGLAAMIGTSYISNIADSEGMREKLEERGISSIKNYIPGFDGYCSLHYGNFFLDLEYMTALRKFAPTEIATWKGEGSRPSVWNVEFGYNLDWGRNLEIALKYAGSDQSEEIGYPRRRYGIGFNQTIFEGVIASLGYFHDKFDDHDKKGRDSRNMVFGQIAVEF